jgi:hypothetical protein
MRPPHELDNSKSPSVLQSDDDFFIDEIALTRSGDDLSDDEIMAALDDDASKNVPPSAPENVPASAPRCIPGPCPKMSQKAARRSAANDRQIIERIQNFELPTGDTLGNSLVATPNTPTNRHATPQSPSQTLPVWEKTSDHLKLFSASLDIMTTAESAPYAFSFNLTPEAITKAKASPAGALDHLKRSLDKVLSRAGLSLPYWFALDIDREERLHIHGAFAAHPELVPAIRSAMTKAWGQWEGAGKHHQLVVKPCNERWAGYAIRNQKRVAKIVGKRVFTIKNRAGAEQTYSIIRSTMAL